MITKKPNVYITTPLPAPAVQRIQTSCEIEMWRREDPVPREMLLERVREIEGLIVDTDRVDQELLDNAPELKVVSEYGVGYDNINVAEATRRGILVGNTPGVLSGSVADFTFALLLGAARRVVEANTNVQAGKWASGIKFGRDIYGATLGIIGLGRIGREVAVRAKGFGMKLIYYDKIRQLQAEEEIGVSYVELDTLLNQSDYITIHTNLLPETVHLIGKKEFEKMKRTCVLVNTSRGAVVDTMELYKALRDEKILAAGIDVTEPEPLPRDHPLLTLRNVIITPHIGSATEPARVSMALLTVDNVIAGLKRQMPPGVVNPEVLGKITS
jgi:glyoxylate reductase